MVWTIFPPQIWSFAISSWTDLKKKDPDDDDFDEDDDDVDVEEEDDETEEIYGEDEED